jgi:phenylacetate-CoA ligase
MEEFTPEEIVGYPSSLYTLAQFITKHAITSIRPKVVLGNSEPMLAFQREVIREAFQCPVHEWYSSTEQAFFAYECPHHSYHIVHPYGIVEIVDSKGMPLEHDATGDIVCTGLTNYAMPLIRYHIGDSASIGTAECPCGNKSEVFKNILGRSDDLLITPDGRSIGRLDPVFKGLNGIKECQIIQKKRDRLLLKIVKDECFSAREETQVITSLQKRIGTAMDIHVEYVDTIPREANGKFRAVVSHLSDT